MNKKILVTIIGIVILISLSVTYVVFKPQDRSNDQATTSPSTNTPAAPQEDAPALREGTYTDYSEDALATTKGTKLLFFHASWCPQCRQIEASIDEFGVPTGVTVFKIDYDSNQKLREKYGVTLQTTFVKIDGDGNKIASYVAYEEPRFSAVERELLR